MEIDTSFSKGRGSGGKEGKLLDPFSPDDEEF